MQEEVQVQPLVWTKKLAKQLKTAGRSALTFFCPIGKAANFDLVLLLRDFSITMITHFVPEPRSRNVIAISNQCGSTTNYQPEH